MRQGAASRANSLVQQSLPLALQISQHFLDPVAVPQHTLPEPQQILLLPGHVTIQWMGAGVWQAYHDERHCGPMQVHARPSGPPAGRLAGGLGLPVPPAPTQLRQPTHLGSLR